MSVYSDILPSVDYTSLLILKESQLKHTKLMRNP